MATLYRLEPNSKPDQNPRRRVLVVEDDLDSVHSMAQLIKMMGHEVQFAINGFAAIDIARAYRPDIIILDIGLPDFKGDQIARQLRYEPGLENTRMIAISGLPQENLEERAREAGCAEFYRKPMDPAKLEQVLSEP
jgi:CheY-like chemotaxis protein